MQLSNECRNRVIRQNTPAPTIVRRFKVKPPPGPSDYETPPLICNKGYSHIKRAPAYTFGQRRPLLEPWSNPDTDLVDIRGMSQKGRHRVPYGLISERPKSPPSSKQSPGPAAYDPEYSVSYKTTPAYTMQARPPAYKEPTDTWSPGPNMYIPPIPGKSIPAFKIKGKHETTKKSEELPGPAEYVADFRKVLKNGPRYTFGYRTKMIEMSNSQPGPDAYCNNKLNLIKQSAPAFSFGIRHSPYLGKFTTYLKQDDMATTTK